MGEEDANGLSDNLYLIYCPPRWIHIVISAFGECVYNVSRTLLIPAKIQSAIGQSLQASGGEEQGVLESD